LGGGGGSQANRPVEDLGVNYRIRYEWTDTVPSHELAVKALITD